MRRGGFPQAHTAIPNLAPMVDVVMVILIFFMLGTSFVLTEGFLPTRLPSRVGPGGAARVSIVPAVWIELSARTASGSCEIRVMGQSLASGDFAGLEGLLRSRRVAGVDSQSRVVIQAGETVSYADVVAAMDACNRAGFGRIQFSVGEGGDD